MKSIGQRRLVAQRLVGLKATTPREVVAWMGALQAQDYWASHWAIGARLASATQDVVEAAIAAKQLVRIWPMRGTLHWVTPQDVRWMLDLMASRIIDLSAGRLRELEITEQDLRRSRALFEMLLQDDTQLTRAEIFAALEAAGISTAGQRGIHLLDQAAMRGLVCCGVRQGSAQTFALLDDWAPPAAPLDRDEALARLAHRYFTSHGPATLPDLARWSGITLRDLRRAVAGASGIVAEMIDGQEHWVGEDSQEVFDDIPRVHLLAAFDEFFIGYANREGIISPLDAGRVVPGNNGVFKPIIVVDGYVVGTWSRTVKAKHVDIVLQPFAPFPNDVIELLEEAAEHYAHFVGKPAQMTVNDPLRP